MYYCARNNNVLKVMCLNKDWNSLYSRYLTNIILNILTYFAVYSDLLLFYDHSSFIPGYIINSEPKSKILYKGINQIIAL